MKKKKIKKKILKVLKELFKEESKGIEECDIPRCVTLAIELDLLVEKLIKKEIK